MKLKIIIWNLVVFISILAVLLLANLSWWAVFLGSVSYTLVLAALTYVYNRIWTAVESKQSVAVTDTANDIEPVSVYPAAWNYYDLVSAMVLGAATGWIIRESNK